MAAAVALGWGGLAGCGGRPSVSASRSTLAATFVDPVGDGMLRRASGESLVDRTELHPAEPEGRQLALVAQITDAHLVDPRSPARLEVLHRLGPPFESTYRPQEALTPRVLAAAVTALDGYPLDAVLDTGDLVDNNQANELGQALGALDGGRIDPGARLPAYDGVQAAADPDPGYYRPDIDPPRHPGLLASAQAPFASSGLHAPWFPVAGNHDLLVGGILAATPQTERLATGKRRIVALPPGLHLGGAVPAELTGAALDGRPRAAALVDGLLASGDLGQTAPVAPDPGRRELGPGGAVVRLRAASALGGGLGASAGTTRVSALGPAGTLSYGVDVGDRVRVIALDAVSRAGGSGGTLSGPQLGWLGDELRRAGSRWVIVLSHQPLAGFASGRRALALLDADPHVLAAVAGHTHRNSIAPRRSPAGGYWLITTASLIDYPQQARILRVVATAGGGVALETWMQDTARDPLADAARELAFLDAEGGRPGGFAGGRLDRNVRLFR